ncbi:MAG: hypothetical protein AAGB26_18145 [Planctomycetota bacterium]
MDAYYMDNLSYPPNTAIAILPPEMVGCLHETTFTKAPPIGRVCDWNGDGSGINKYDTNLSIHITNTEQRSEMERRFDDSDSSTGTYRAQKAYLVGPVGP